MFKRWALPVASLSEIIFLPNSLPSEARNQQIDLTAADAVALLASASVHY